MSWRCLAQSEDGIARPRTGYALGTHWADFGNVEPNPNRTMPWSGRRLLSTCAVTRRRFSSGCKPHPATAPAGSDRSRHGGDEVSEAVAGLEFFQPLAPVAASGEYPDMPW